MLYPGRMRTLACLILALAAAQAQDLDRLLEQDAVDPFEGALAVARLIEPELDPLPAQELLDAAARQLTQRLQTAGNDAQRGEALARAVHRTLELVVEDDSARERDPDAFLPHRVLARKRGACLGLTLVYLALARRCGLPARAVAAPGHVFVRLGALNLETTLEGAPRDEAWIRERTGLPPEGKPGNYLRELSDRELVAEVLNGLGGALVSEGHPARALPLLRRATALAPDSPGAAYNLALALHAAGKPAAAAKPLERALTLHSTREALNLRGLLALDRDRPDLALADFSSLIERHPQEARYWNNRGITRCRMGLLADGLRDLDRALELRPEWAEARLNRGLARLELGRIEEAARDLSAATPGDWRATLSGLPAGATVGRHLVRLAGSLRGDARAAALFAGGDRLLAANQAKEASGAFDRALDLPEHRVEAYCKRGLACERLGDELWAKRNYYLATQADPSAPMGYRYFGYHYLRRDQFATAVDYFTKYLARAASDAPDRGEIEELVRTIQDALGQ